MQLPDAITAARYRVLLPGFPPIKCTGSDARRLADEHGGQIQQSLVTVHRDGTETLGSWRPDTGDRYDRAELVELFRAIADGRREYLALVEAAGDPLARATIEAEVNTLESVARVIAGDRRPLYSWLPSWRWTPGMHTALHDTPTGPTAAPRAPTGAEPGTTPPVPATAPPAPPRLSTAPTCPQANPQEAPTREHGHG